MRQPAPERAFARPRVSRRALLCAALALAAIPLPRGAAAAMARHALRIDRDVAYGTADGMKLLLDVYRPLAPCGNRPAVVLVHGGGWVAGSKADLADEAQELARAGYVAFSVSYRLAQQNTGKWPAQLDYVQRSVRWIRANARRYRVAADRIGALGTSAGGHLAAFLGTRDTRDNRDRALAPYSSRVACVVDLFGPTDFTVDPSSAGGPGAFPVQLLLGKKAGTAPQAFRDASPIAFVDRHSAPFLILHGTRDALVPIEQSERLQAALRGAGVESTLIRFVGEGHGLNGKAGRARMMSETLRFLNAHLRPSVAPQAHR